MFWLKGSKDKIVDKIKTLDSNIKDSFDNLKQDMKKVSDWITSFNGKEGLHDTKINELEERLEQLSFMVEQLNKPDVVERSNDKFEQSEEAYTGENRRVFNHVQPFNRSVQPFMNVHEHSDLSVLTPAQKQVIALLTYSGGPMSYDEISRGLGINEITARRHINDIRRAGFGIKRKVSVKNRRNMFYLDEEVRNKLSKSEEPVKTPKNKPK